MRRAGATGGGSRFPPSFARACAAPFVAACLAWGVWSSPRPHASQGGGRRLVWESFARARGDYARQRLADGDVIAVAVTHPRALPASQRLVRWSEPEPADSDQPPVPRDRVEVVLVAGPGVTLWKGLTAFGSAPGGRDENWARLAQVDTQGGDRGPERMLLAVADLSGGLKLSFEKAQAFGARAPVYTFDVPNVSRAGGHRITFTWERDD